MSINSLFLSSDVFSGEQIVEPITWESSLITGHPEVDRQHRALFVAFNHLLEAMERGKGSEEVHETLIFLKEYTINHFRMEEALMDEHKYPGSAGHKALHQDFADKLEDLLDRHERGASVTISVMQFLKNWLLEHIHKADKRLAKYIR